MRSIWECLPFEKTSHLRKHSIWECVQFDNAFCLRKHCIWDCISFDNAFILRTPCIWERVPFENVCQLRTFFVWECSIWECIPLNNWSGYLNPQKWNDLRTALEVLPSSYLCGREIIVQLVRFFVHPIPNLQGFHRLKRKPLSVFFLKQIHQSMVLSRSNHLNCRHFYTNLMLHDWIAHGSKISCCSNFQYFRVVFVSFFVHLENTFIIKIFANSWNILTRTFQNWKAETKQKTLGSFKNLTSLISWAIFILHCAHPGEKDWNHLFLNFLLPWQNLKKQNLAD